MDINDDEFSLDEEQQVSAPKASKSMKSVYEELARRTPKEESIPKVKREKGGKQVKEERVKAPEKEGKTITKTRGDETCVRILLLRNISKIVLLKDS